MKKFTSLLIGCSLALAGAAWAQQPEEQTTPTKGKHATEQTQTTEAQPGSNAAKPEATVAKERGAGKHERAGSKGQKAEMTPKSEASPNAGTNAAGETGANATPGGKHQAGQQGKGKNARGANANASPSATPATAASASATPVAAATPNATPVATAAANTAPSVAAAGQQNAGANAGANAGGKVKKADPQKLQQIKTQHANFKAQPKPDKVPAVTFNQSYRIQGSERWQGPQYEVFRSYHPERHDQGWYHSHYPRVELIGGGYYYFNNGYWYPAWGYSTSAEYYAYDAPIYVGHRAEPPDRVIADVQAELQDMGYYKGEVDGLLGPLTREALTAYQTDQGLMTTSVIDEPTLDSLGMS
jgi:Putative peptidoglycan binding domain